MMLALLMRLTWIFTLNNFLRLWEFTIYVGLVKRARVTLGCLSSGSFFCLLCGQDSLFVISPLVVFHLLLSQLWVKYPALLCGMSIGLIVITIILLCWIFFAFFPFFFFQLDLLLGFCLSSSTWISILKSIFMVFARVLFVPDDSSLLCSVLGLMSSSFYVSSSIIHH